MHRLWDKLGISLSFLCLLHCMLLPFLLMLLPSMEHFLGEHEHIHAIFAIIIWPTALLAFIPAYKHHKKKWIPGLAVLGLSLITLSIFSHELDFEFLEMSLSIIGSLILVYAHYQNYVCNRCNSCHDDHHEDEATHTHNH